MTVPPEVLLIDELGNLDNVTDSQSDNLAVDATDDVDKFFGDLNVIKRYYTNQETHLSYTLTDNIGSFEIETYAITDNKDDLFTFNLLADDDSATVVTATRTVSDAASGSGFWKITYTVDVVAGDFKKLNVLYPSFDDGAGWEVMLGKVSVKRKDSTVTPVEPVVLLTDDFSVKPDSANEPYTYADTWNLQLEGPNADRFFGDASTIRRVGDATDWNDGNTYFIKHASTISYGFEEHIGSFELVSYYTAGTENNLITFQVQKDDGTWEAVLPTQVISDEASTEGTYSKVTYTLSELTGDYKGVSIAFPVYDGGKQWDQVLGSFKVTAKQ